MEVDESKCPFKVFPEEIWPIIIEQITEQEDALNVFSAFPQFRNLWDDKLHATLMTSVMPQIFPMYLNTCDIKACRRVSKGWKRAVDMVLETHQDRVPCYPSGTKKLAETHFNYSRLPNIVTNFRKFRYAFHNYGISTASKAWNPFPGRKVNFIVGGNELHPFYRCPEIICTDFIEALPAVEMFGHHIHSFNFDILRLRCRSYESLINGVIEPLFQFLSYLPKLKSLRIRLEGVSGHAIKEEERTRLYEVIATSTAFPFRLDSLDLNVIKVGIYSNELHGVIISDIVTYNHVKKLDINPALWERGHGSLFPNLTQLFLHTPPSMENMLLNLRNILEDLKSKHLKKLQVITHGESVVDLLEILLPYKIESLELVGGLSGDPLEIVNAPLTPTSRSPRKSVVAFIGRRTLSHRSSSTSEDLVTPPKRLVSATSIRSLRLKLIPTPYLGFYFLKSLPSLRYLTIDILYWVSELDKNFQCGLHSYMISKDVLVRSLFDFDYKRKREAAYFMFIWNELPNLRVLRINVKNENPLCPVESYRYVRECNGRAFSRFNTSS